mmetsp:Transcript_125753/g.298512  ORF Transcript_125753/g.298512 Transcript_125753/m.298512 type:complete len:93 (+) Transcript_125753:100-378(+)
MKQSPTSSLRGVVFCTCISDATSPEFVCDSEKLWTGESGHLCWMDIFTEQAKLFTSRRQLSCCLDPFFASRRCVFTEHFKLCYLSFFVKSHL